MTQPTGSHSTSFVSSPATPPVGSVPPLHDPLAAFAPPHHQSGHEEGDEDGHHDEGPQDAVGRVPEEPS